MNRLNEITTTGPVSIETYLDGKNDGIGVVVLPSYGRDGGEDFDAFVAPWPRRATVCCGRSRAASAALPVR